MRTYTEQELQNVLAGVTPPDSAAMARARAHQESLAKPPGSLGRLEDIAVQLAGITGSVHPRADRRRIVILSADNGVLCEGVSSTPKSVTLSQTINFARGLTGVATLARHFDTELCVVDVGIDADFVFPGVLDRKIAHGTCNIAVEPAMTRSQAVTAVMVGVEMAEKAKNEGVEILGVGEMGAGNTTTSAAVLSALTGLSPEVTAGRGAGLLDQAFLRKKEIITDALARMRPDPADPIDVVSKVGGLDIAAMAGVFLGAARCRIPAVVDGYISIVAALLAVRLCPGVRDYLILSHASFEQGYRHAAEELDLRPMLLLDMRLGEGSGCPIAFSVISAACAIQNEMGTFEQAGIDDAYLEEIRKGDKFSV